jgi:heat shock protein HslJ
MSLKLSYLMPLLTLAVVAAGCNWFPLLSTSDPLAGTRWQLVELVTDEGTRYERSDVDLSFDSTGRVHTSSCNICNGSYETSGSQLLVDRMACTRRACPPEVIELAQYVEGATRFSRDGERLTLSFEDVQGARGEARFTARGAPQSD